MPVLFRESYEHYTKLWFQSSLIRSRSRSFTHQEAVDVGEQRQVAGPRHGRLVAARLVVLGVDAAAEATAGWFPPFKHRRVQGSLQGRVVKVWMYVWMQPQKPLLAGFLRSRTDGCRAACEAVEVWQ